MKWISLRPNVGLVSVIAALLLAGVTPLAAQGQGGMPVPDRFIFERPIPRGAVQRIASGYPYGWHRRQQSPIHHGVDMVNPTGTPILAAAAGTVYYAGSDAERIFGPQPNFYGNLVVIAHDIDAPEGGRLFTLYGHMRQIDVSAEMRVEAGQRIGAVGSTGIALGPHLHFEVRLGSPNDYNAVRNPELWLKPLPGTGTLIGRILNADGSPAPGVRYVVANASAVWPGFTYADPTLPTDPQYGENLAMTDLRAGCYTLRVRGQIETRVCIRAGEATLIEVRLP